MGIKKRLYEDYIKSSRLDLYEETLRYAKSNGYEMLGVYDFYNKINNNGISKNSRILLNRHDIDTSSKVAREMFEIEQKVFSTSGSSTFYFRDSTIDNSVIRLIESFGYETGYHYETIANYEKKRNCR